MALPLLSATCGFSPKERNMTSMTTPDPVPETSHAAAPVPINELHIGAKIGLWLLVGTMALFAFGNVRELLAAMFR
jgi:hypothetical protein